MFVLFTFMVSTVCVLRFRSEFVKHTCSGRTISVTSFIIISRITGYRANNSLCYLSLTYLCVCVYVWSKMRLIANQIIYTSYTRVAPVMF